MEFTVCRSVKLMIFIVYVPFFISIGYFWTWSTKKNLPMIVPRIKSVLYRNQINDKEAMDRKYMWRPIGKPWEMVYSAFLEDNSTTLRVIGTTLLKKKTTRYWCIIYKQRFDGNSTCVVEATVNVIPEHHNMKYTAAYFMCKITCNVIPEAVSVVYNISQVPQNVVPVWKPTKQSYKFTVCVSPFHINYNKEYEFVEMMELNKILGADHFVFYNFSTGPKVNRILEFYKEKGDIDIDILNWNLPIRPATLPTSDDLKVHYYAQLAAINDCLYRSKGVSKYVVFQDLDEFIIPRKLANWEELINSLPEKSGSYVVRGSFFRIDKPDVNTSFTGRKLAQKIKSVTILKQTRETHIFATHLRSKCIVIPSRVITVGIHNIWKHQKGYNSYNVNPNVALLQHYRSVPDRNQSLRDDNGIMPYKDLLLDSLVKTWNQLNKTYQKN